jgi:hypothetical protein
MKKINKKLLLLIVAILMLISLFRFSEGIGDFSTYNPYWNGGEQIRKLMSENHQVIAVPVRSDLASFEPNKTAFVILGPKENFSEKDIGIIKNFVESGGLLVLADDYGSGNELLNKMTTSVSFSNMLLRDDISSWKNGIFPSASTSIANVSNITMNYATSLVIKNDSVKVLSSSSRFSRISKNEFERGEIGSYPVICKFSYDKGEIVAIADPSIFINSMLPMEGNKRLLEELVGNRTSVIFDDSESMPYVSYSDYLIKTNPSIQYLFAGIVIFLVFIYMNRGKIVLFARKKTSNQGHNELDEEHIISDILKRNKWSERKLMLFKTRLKEKK